MRAVRKKKAKRRARAIVEGYLEKVSSRVFEDYRKQITALIRENYGIYALYRRDKLYYVGLATDLKRRINQHLRDRHSGKWDRFSLYIIRKQEHIRELECLLLRIADPSGNTQRGRLQRSRDLLPVLKRRVKSEIVKTLEELFGETGKRREPTSRGKHRPGGKNGGTYPLAGLLPANTRLKAVYKGKSYAAYVRASGEVFYNGTRYKSPSAAGQAVTKRSTDGWFFWKARDKAGKWVSLDKFRKTRRKTRRK